MQLEPITLPVNLELSAKSKALLDFLRLQDAEDKATANTQQPATATIPIAVTPSMGDYWNGQGGYYICTLPALMGMPARHLIAASTEADNLTFGPSEEINGANSHIDGAANTEALLASGKPHPAAKWASEYTADGHNDFFLPAKLDMVMAHICAKQRFKTSGWYWSSTQSSRGNAFVQVFETGFSDWGIKGLGHRVRAFRAIPL